MVANAAAPRQSRATSRRPASPNARRTAPAAALRVRSWGSPRSDSSVAASPR